MKRFKKPVLNILLGIFVILLIGFLIPQKFTIPVKGADSHSYNPESFWYYPWGKSVTHKGVDIFAEEGTDVVSSTGGIVIFTGTISMGGNVIVVLGPKWRLHYYAHLQEIRTHKFALLHSGENIAAVGTTGNAHGKAPHLHYTIRTVFPYFWRNDKTAPQGWKKMFYLNPIAYMPKH